MRHGMRWPIPEIGGTLIMNQDHLLSEEGPRKSPSYQTNPLSLSQAAVLAVLVIFSPIQTTLELVAVGWERHGRTDLKHQLSEAHVVPALQNSYVGLDRQTE